jgi:hypothetical protein
VLSSIFTAFATESVILTEGSPVSPHYCFILLGLDAQALSDTMEVDVAEDQIPPSVIRHCFQRFAEPYHSGTTVEKKDNVTTQTQPDGKMIFMMKLDLLMYFLVMQISNFTYFQRLKYVVTWVMHCCVLARLVYYINVCTVYPSNANQLACSQSCL